MSDERYYNIVRFYQDTSHRRIIRKRVTLDQAKAWCSDPETSSRTCTNKVGRARTRRIGAWFDGYEQR